MSLSPRGRFILSVSLGYALSASLWVTASDRMLKALTDASTITALATAKGMAFVTVTTALLVMALRAVPHAHSQVPPARPSRSWPVLLAFGVAVVVIGVIAVLAFQVQSAAVRAERWNQLQAVARLEVDAVSRWLDDRRRIARGFSSSPPFLAFVTRWRHGADAADLQRLTGALDGLRGNFGFVRIELRDSSGDLIAASGTIDVNDDDIRAAAATAARTGRPVSLDLHRNTPDGMVHLADVTPLAREGSGDRPVGTITTVISAEDFLFPYLRIWPLPGATGETMLVRRDGGDLVLNPLRHDPDAAFKVRLSPTLRGLMAAGERGAASGDGAAVGAAVGEGLDYRDVQVLAAAVPVPGTRWTLLAKVDEAEVLGDIRDLAGLTGVLTMGALTLAAAVIGFLWQRQQLAAALRDAALANALKTSESRFRSYIENCPMAVLVTDGDGRFVDCNPAALDLLDCDRGTLLTLNFSAVIPDADGEEAERAFRTLRRDGNAEYAGRLVSRAGRTPWVQFRAVALADGHVLAFCHDVTEQRQAAAALRDSEARFSTVFHASPVGIGLGDLDGVLLDVNQAWLDIVGYSREEAIGRTTAELGIYDQPADRLRVIAALNAQSKVGGLELPYRRKGGERIDVQYSAEIVRISGKSFLLVMITDITRRKAEALALTRYREIVERLADPVAFVDRDLRLATVNPAYCAMLGEKLEDLPGRGVAEIIPPEPYAVARGRFAAALAGETQFHTVEDVFPDGRHHVYDARLSPFLADGAVVGVVVHMHDVTELRQTQQMLEAAQAMAGVFSWSMDIVRGVYTTSPVNRQRFGWPGGEVSEADVDRLVHPDDSERRRAAWRAALAGGPYDIEYRLIIEERTIWVRVKAEIEFDAERRPVSAHGMMLNITAMREAQTALETYRDHLEDLVAARTAELKAAESKMRLILESSGDGLFGVDTAGRITFVNRAACALLGYDAERLLGVDAHATLHHARLDGTPYPEEACPLLATLRTGEGARLDDEVFWRADGSALPVSCSTHPMHQDGVLVGAVVSFADISERKHTEEARETALAEAERLARVRREFLANMSHEIRTPLTAVLGLAHVGQHENAGRKTALTFARILDAGQTLLGIVNDILDFSKIEAGKFTLERRPLVLGEVIDRAVEMVAVRAFAKGLDLRVEEGFDLPGVCLGDGLRLAQVLGNLLSNAVKFTGGGSGGSGGGVVLAVRRDGGWLEFAVTDTGIGMTPDHVARLFRPFEQADGSTTRHFGGTGLGLAITRNLVELMGGTIVAASRPGVGSVFTVRVPVEGAEDAPAHAGPDGIALCGLSAADEAVLLPALRRRGIDAVPLAPGDAIPDQVGLVLFDADAAAGPGHAAVDGALARGGRVALLTTPGRAGLSPGLAERVQVIERPLRVRHLLAAPSTARPQPAAGRPRLEGRRILVAEDNEVNQLVLTELLTLEGARPDCVANGRQAVERVERLGGDAYDVVLSDVQMPEMDGYDLARRLAALAPGLPVIGLTAHAMAEERDRCLAAGMVEHVAKPVSIEALVPIILRHARAVGMGRASPPPAAPLIDRTRLRERYEEQDPFIDTLLATVRQSHAGTPAELRAAARGGDHARLAMLAHTLKGTAGNIVADPLLDLAQRTEAAARGRSGLTAGQIAGLADELADAVDALLAEVTEALP